MKVTLIHGQNHKGSSYHTSRLLVDALPGTPEIEEFFLPRDLNHFCTGCYACIQNKSACPFYEEKKRIMDSVLDSQLLIFTTPTYCLAPSAPMKTFLDLTFTWWMSHTPAEEMFRKRAVVISTAAGAGAKKATKGLAETLFYWGVPWIRQYGAAIQAMNWESVKPKKKERLSRDMTRLAKKAAGSEPPFVGLPTRFIFFIMGKMQKAGFGSSPGERTYWEEKGWLGKVRPWRS